VLFDVVDAVVTPKTRGGRGEDRLVITENYAAVVDGATAKDVADAREGVTPSPGERLAELVADSVPKLSPNLESREVIAVITGIIRQHAASAGFPSASLLLYSATRREAIVVGAGSVRIDNEEQTFVHPHETVAAAARSVYLLELLREGAKPDDLRATDPGRQLVLPLLQKERLLRNVDLDGGVYFGAIDGQRVPPRFLEVLAVPDGARLLTLASDGYPRLLNDFAATELYLQDLLASDPLMIGRHLSAKGVRPGDQGFDDRTYVQLSLRVE
jgi:hypothetical protein